MIVRVVRFVLERAVLVAVALLAGYAVGRRRRGSVPQVVRGVPGGALNPPNGSPTARRGRLNLAEAWAAVGDLEEARRRFDLMAR